MKEEQNVWLVTASGLASQPAWSCKNITGISIGSAPCHRIDDSLLILYAGHVPTEQHFTQESTDEDTDDDIPVKVHGE
jgi:hypothetical protein